MIPRASLDIFLLCFNSAFFWNFICITADTNRAKLCCSTNRLYYQSFWYSVAIFPIGISLFELHYTIYVNRESGVLVPLFHSFSIFMSATGMMHFSTLYFYPNEFVKLYNNLVTFYKIRRKRWLQF